MSRSEKIRQIINTRASKRGEVEQRKQWLENVRSSVDKLQKLIPAMQEFANDSSVLEGVKQAADTAAGNIRNLDVLLGRLDARYTRSTLKIGIVGVPKQGKSTFLQSLTGLDEETVPTGDVWVTGAPSYLCNDEGAAETFAIVHPYSKAAFLNDVLRPFYRELDMRPINRIEDLLSTDMPDGKGLTPTQLKKLERLVSLKNHYNDYRDLLDGAPFRIAKSQIREFVAQHDISGSKDYHKWYAVEYAEVHCKFPQNEVGDIMVCDTPGLGDFTAGAREKLTAAMYREMDVVFLLKRLDPNDQNVSEQDTEFIGAINDPNNAYPVGEWTYIIINKKAGDAMRPDFRSRISSGLLCPNIYELDAKDTNEVSAQFEAILNSVVTQMPKLDELLCQDYDKQTKALKDSIAGLVEQASKSIRKAVPSSRRAVVRGRAGEMVDQMSARFTKLLEEYSTPEMLGAPEFVKAMKKVLEGMKKAPEMPYTAINEQAPNVWMSNMETSLRSEMTFKFAELDGKLEELIQAMRSRVADIITAPEGGNLGFLTKGSDASVWSSLKDAFTGSDVQEPEYWVRAIETLEGMQLPVRSFFLPHIVSILDLFDPKVKKTDPLVLSLEFKPGDNLETCRKKLSRKWEYARDTIEGNILDDDSENQVTRAVMRVPGLALAAAIKEFMFAWFHGGGERACQQRWQDFYGEYADLIWTDEFGEDASSPFALGIQWKDCVNCLKASIIK